MNSSRCTIRDVHILAASFMAVTEFGGEGGNVYERVRVGWTPDVPYAPFVRGGRVPQPRLSANADVFHSYGTRKGPRITNCTFEFAVGRLQPDLVWLLCCPASLKTNSAFMPLCLSAAQRPPPPTACPIPPSPPWCRRTRPHACARVCVCMRVRVRVRVRVCRQADDFFNVHNEMQVGPAAGSGWQQPAGKARAGTTLPCHHLHGTPFPSRDRAAQGQ